MLQLQNLYHNAVLYWSPDHRLYNQNDTAGLLCDGATGRGQQSKACQQLNLYGDVKCKKRRRKKICFGLVYI